MVLHYANWADGKTSVKPIALLDCRHKIYCLHSLPSSSKEHALILVKSSFTDMKKNPEGFTLLPTFNLCCEPRTNPK
jgi:hypothetical protein